MRIQDVNRLKLREFELYISQSKWKFYSKFRDAVNNEISGKFIIYNSTVNKIKVDTLERLVIITK